MTEFGGWLGIDKDAGRKKMTGAKKRSWKIFWRFIWWKINKMIEFLFAGLLQCAMIQDMTQFGLCLDELVNTFNSLQNTQDEEIISKTN